MEVSTGYKAEMMAQLFSQVGAYLAAESEGGEATADDIIDFFAFGIAMVIDNDSDLRTPRDLRLASDTAKALIDRNVKALRAMHENGEPTFLAMGCRAVPRLAK